MTSSFSQLLTLVIPYSYHREELTCPVGRIGTGVMERLQSRCNTRGEVNIVRRSQDASNLSRGRERDSQRRRDQLQHCKRRHICSGRRVQRSKGVMKSKHRFVLLGCRTRPDPQQWTFPSSIYICNNMDPWRYERTCVGEPHGSNSLTVFCLFGQQSTAS